RPDMVHGPGVRAGASLRRDGAGLAMNIRRVGYGHSRRESIGSARSSGVRSAGQGDRMAYARIFDVSGRADAGYASRPSNAECRRMLASAPGQIDIAGHLQQPNARSAVDQNPPDSAGSVPEPAGSRPRMLQARLVGN